ncbi:carboxylating nicotinate-nucleotide diphosphorylase [bacterium]|nr:carboxylating nicotinate-nucleotide diphosphorylase [bacterium]
MDERVRNRDLESTFPRDPWLDDLVRQSLEEDIGTGDATTAVAVDPELRGEALLVPRQPGVVAGLPLLAMVYGALDPRVEVSILEPEGTTVPAGRILARLEGPVSSLLTGERTALNFLQHLGGIATLTARYVAAVRGTGCLVLDTRKTLPGYRLLAKYAVRCGGGANHRLGLYDRVMLKDNHWTGGSGGIAAMVARSRRLYPGLAVEVEVDGLDQFAQVLGLGVEWILLDNFTVEQTREAVRLRDVAAVPTRLESSGNIDLESIGSYAAAGSDAVSIGRLTHSAPAWDLGLDMTPLGGDSGGGA